MCVCECETQREGEKECVSLYVCMHAYVSERDCVCVRECA